MSAKPTSKKSAFSLSRLRPLAIDRYLIVEVLMPFFGALSFLIFVLLMFQMLRMTSAFIEHSVPLPILGKIIWYMVLTFLPLVLPPAFLMSVLAAFGRLSEDHEVTAMKANGISIYRITAPVIAVALVIASLSFGLNFNWGPEAKFGWRSTVIRLTNTSPTATIREGTFTTGFFGLLIYAERVDPDTNRLKNVFIYDDRNPNDPHAIIAPYGQIVPVKTDSDLGASIALNLYEGEMHSNSTSAGTYQKGTFREYKIHLNVAEGANNAVGNFLNLRYGQLVDALGTVTHPILRNQIRTEIFSRWFTSLTPLLFVLIGIGVGTVRGRNSRSGTILITLLVIIPTYLVQVTSQNLGYNGVLPPPLAAAIPDLLLLIVGIFAYRRSTW